MKLKMLIAVLATVFTVTAYSQTLPTITDFNSVATDYGGGAFGDAGQGFTQNGNNIAVTLSNDGTGYSLYVDPSFGGGTIDLSSYSQIEWDLSGTGAGTFTQMSLTILGSDYVTPIATWDFALTGAALDTYVYALGTPGDFNAVGGFLFNINGSGAPGSASFSGTFDNLQAAIPEPSTFALLGLGAAALYLLRRKQK